MGGRRTQATKQVFLIHAHKDLDQLNALVEQLLDDDFLIYVNLDRKCNLEPARVHAAARLIAKRIDVHWGAFSQVQATLNSLAQIVDEVSDFDKVHFISAQDFPLLSNACLKEGLAELRDRELIDVRPLGTGVDEWPINFRYQYFFCRKNRHAFVRRAYSALKHLMRASGLQRRLPNGLRPYGGSSWWSLSKGCIVDVLGSLAHEPRLIRFFSSTLCPDEMVFQTLVMNSRYAHRVLGRNYRHVQWPETGAHNPDILREADFARIAASGAYFCRKIDSRVSAALVPRLVALRAVKTTSAQTRTGTDACIG